MTSRDTIDPLALYAAGIDGSDYVARVVPPIRQAIGPVGALLDIGAGGGQLGAALRAPDAPWTAVEPGPSMQARLRALDPPPRLRPCGWREADLGAREHDTVLAANVAAPLGEARDFLSACRRAARRHVVWVVPAQEGPRGLCLAGCLPAEWHGEDETPGVEIVLRQLPPEDRPARLARTPWSFVLDVPDLPEIAAYLATRLGWPADDARRPALLAHLDGAATEGPNGLRLVVPRASAILVWSIT